MLLENKDADRKAVRELICSKAEHQLLLPLWQPSAQAQPIFEDLVAWHRECFGKDDGPRLSGSKLESDQKTWTDLGI